MQWICLKGYKWTDYKYPLWVVHWLAVLASLAQSRTVLNPAGVHCACDRAATTYKQVHQTRPGGWVGSSGPWSGLGRV